MSQSPDIRSVLAAGAGNDAQVSRVTHAACAQVRIIGCPPAQPTRFYVLGQNFDNKDLVPY